MNNINNKNVLTSIILAIIVVVLFAVLVSFSAQRDQETNNANTSGSIQPTEYPVDTVNDGIYTNYEYGFKFNYPNAIFSQQIIPSNFEDRGLFRQEWFQSESNNKLFLSVEVWNLNKPKSNDVQNYLEISEKEDNTDFGVSEINYFRKLKDLNVKFEDGIVYYKEIDHSSHKKEVIYSYVFAWKENNYLITILLNSNNKNILTDNKSIFDSVVESLTLINSESFTTSSE